MIGRIRTVKPEIFSDEKLWDLSLETGLPLLQAFEGLWCYADREGRFEWRPRALKTLILPYWEGDFADALEALERGRYVVRYVVDGQTFGYVRSFAKHQRVNQREAPSTLPSPPVTTTHVHAHAGVAPVPEPSPAVDHPARGEGNGRELEGKGVGTELARAPVPEVPGLDRVGGVARTYTMPSEIPPKAYLDTATMGGVSTAQAKSTWKHYWGAGLPPSGVEKLHDWLTQRAVERGNQLARAPKSGPRESPGSDLDTTSAATAFRLDTEHREFAQKLGRRSDIEAFAREYAQGETCRRLDTLGQSRDFMNRLKCLAHTGQWHPDGPLPKPPAKAREARAQ